ncbi:hypothetical protein FGD77_12755 [Roseovarius sp. M141]|nr:hypothetical protein [Roseovarius sp. M141]
MVEDAFVIGLDFHVQGGVQPGIDEAVDHADRRAALLERLIQDHRAFLAEGKAEKRVVIAAHRRNCGAQYLFDRPEPARRGRVGGGAASTFEIERNNAHRTFVQRHGRQDRRAVGHLRQLGQDLALGSIVELQNRFQRQEPATLHVAVSRCRAIGDQRELGHIAGVTVPKRGRGSGQVPELIRADVIAKDGDALDSLNLGVELEHFILVILRAMVWGALCL